MKTTVSRVHIATQQFYFLHFLSLSLCLSIVFYISIYFYYSVCFLFSFLLQIFLSIFMRCDAIVTCTYTHWLHLVCGSLLLFGGHDSRLIWTLWSGVIVVFVVLSVILSSFVDSHQFLSPHYWASDYVEIIKLVGIAHRKACDGPDKINKFRYMHENSNISCDQSTLFLDRHHQQQQIITDGIFKCVRHSTSNWLNWIYCLFASK